MSGLLTHFINEEMVLAALKGVIDPELGLNVVDLGANRASAGYSR